MKNKEQVLLNIDYLDNAYHVDLYCVESNKKLYIKFCNYEPCLMQIHSNHRTVSEFIDNINRYVRNAKKEGQKPEVFYRSWEDE